MRETMKQCFTQEEIAAWKPRKIANNTWRYGAMGRNDE